MTCYLGTDEMKNCIASGRYRLVTVHDLMNKPDEFFRGMFMLGIIVSITLSTKGASKFMQRGPGGQNRSVASATFTRSMRVMDPLSPAGSNAVMIFYGNGHNDAMFSVHLRHRDGGVFSKFLCH